MRKIGLSEIEDIALGASLLGAGGGGDPYIGKLVAMGAVKERGPVTLLDPEEIPDDALVVPIAMMGAPTILGEKGVGGKEYEVLYNMISQYYGKKIFAFMPIEAGGVNSMLPIAAAARLGLPMVDADGMGRAFPELQMVTFTMAGISATPMALVDGANRWQKMWHITLPAIKSTIVIMLILKVGSILNTGYEQIFLMQNSMNRTVSDVFDTYIYTKGVVNGNYSLATAAGMFKSVVSMIMVLGANRLAKAVGESGFY